MAELAAVSGLRGVLLDQTQLLALASALVRELSINVTAD
ncbi:hypothetical protein FHR83_005503 [Actinoplanes campanulatus]|uniref:Uncharacterized protein n=1 Tax=Actinoplanes campanulatus TaxID=113559 RepID=A0A7W5AL06_9ACTN|nr:hypothetical protein [Actinoplanes campanulatus]